MDKFAFVSMAFEIRRRTQRAFHRIDCLDVIKARGRANYAAHREQRKAEMAARGAKLKLAALNAYGGPVCACCGETLFEGLAIDHINGDGAECRRRSKAQRSRLYQWLRDNHVHTNRIPGSLFHL
jgi:hypothetical protein